MTFNTQSSWWAQFRKDLNELAVIRTRAMRGAALTAALQDGNGVKGVRQGCYTLGDVLALLDVAAWDAPAAVRRRLDELEPDVLPQTSRDMSEIRNLFGAAAAGKPAAAPGPAHDGFCRKAPK